MQFDVRAAKLLEPGAHIILSDYPGLRLKAAASGKVWVYRYKSLADGRMRQIKIGGWPAMSAAKAIVEWEVLRARRDAGADPAAERRASRAAEKVAASLPERSGPYLVRDVCAESLEHLKLRRKEKGWRQVERLFNATLNKFGAQEAAGVTRRAAFDFLDQFKKTPSQAAKLKSELAIAWDYALDAGKLPETTPNWWRMIMRGHFKSKGKKIAGKHIGTKKRVLSPQELAILIPWLSNFSRTVEDICTMYLWTGTRGAESCSICAEEVTDEADGLWWTIPKEKTKNARLDNATDLRVPLTGRAESIVRRRMQLIQTGPLYPNRKGTGPIQQQIVQGQVYIYQPYSKTRPTFVRPRLPVTHWAPHDLRRTTRTILASLGCPDEVAESVIGHVQPGIKGVYNLHEYDKERRLWLTRVDQYLESLLVA
jgi:integrase